MMTRSRLTVIIGPTASGKTAHAIKLAKATNGAVISADSRQVYSGMNIGSAKPNQAWTEQPHDVFTPDIVDGVDHYLLNIRRPDNPMTLSEWQEAAFKAINMILAEGRTPLLVGGTMLYADSIIYNYDLPKVAENIELREELELKATDDLYQELIKKDMAAAEFIQPQNKRRIIRALEVIEATGKPFSEVRKKRLPKYDVKIIGLNLGWPIIDERVDRRIKKMLDDGLIEEVESLMARYGDDLPMLATINYGQAVDFLKGEITEVKMREKMVQANKRYARRQMSWWRRNEDINWMG